MATRKPSAVLTGEVLDEMPTTIELSREQLEELARAWEGSAQQIEDAAATALERSQGFGDLALVLVSGSAAQVRSDCLRDCAQDLRDLIESATPRRGF